MPLVRLARGVFWACFAYWAVYALVAPVTNIDSQMYNVARITLALKGGLFGNPFFTSAFQVMWPWTFDSLYLPFLVMGFGYAIPSFCSLAGTLYVAFKMTRARFGTDAAWAAVTGLMALTCLVYQGTSTKNDIPILFAGAVWLYARQRWKTEQRGVHIFWMLLALGFMAGAKTTGAAYALILGILTICELWGNRAIALRATLGLFCSFVLFGSIETYIESQRVFGHVMGPPEIVGQLRNQDGIRGGAANLSRYVMGSIYLGPTTLRPAASTASTLAGAERDFLAVAALTDAGTDPRFGDRALFFYQTGFEELSGFGPIGTIAVVTILLAALRWRPRSTWWQLALGSAAGLVLVSMSVAYNPWTNRYLITWYALATVATVCLLWDRDTPMRKVSRWIFLCVAIAGAVMAPYESFNRGPESILASIADRDHFETCAYPLIGKVRDRLRILHAKAPSSRVYFVVCNDSLVLPILEDTKLDPILVTPPAFLRLVSGGHVANGDLVIEDFPTGSPVLRKIEDVSAPDIFSDNLTRTQAIYQVAGETGNPSPMR
jgi:hypothetical protein